MALPRRKNRFEYAEPVVPFRTFNERGDGEPLKYGLATQALLKGSRSPPAASYVYATDARVAPGAVTTLNGRGVT